MIFKKTSQGRFDSRCVVAISRRQNTSMQLALLMALCSSQANLPLSLSTARAPAKVIPHHSPKGTLETRGSAQYTVSTIPWAKQVFIK